MNRLAITLAVGLSMFACNRGPRAIAKGEPGGQIVELTPADLDGYNWAAAYSKPWVYWHFKGIGLAKQEGKDAQLQAIYCFHQALAAWPKKMPEDATQITRMTYKEEATDTLLQLGWLYLKMSEPKFALAYFKRAELYMPGDPHVMRGIADAEAMISAR